MKKVRSFLLLFGLFSVAAMAQPYAKIKFIEHTHDFGVISEDKGKVTATFAFVNQGDVPLIIRSCQASCGCTTPVFTKEPIAPGRTGEITVTYDPMGRPGSFVKNISVFANTNPDQTILIIKGEVTPMAKPTSETPEYPYSIGDIRLAMNSMPFLDVYVNRPKTQRISLINKGNKSLTPLIERAPRHLYVRVEPKTLAPQQRGELIITYNAELAKDWGVRKDDFFFKADPSQANNITNAITVTANIQDDFANLTPEQRVNAPKISVATQTIDFGELKAPAEVKKVVKITNTGKSNLQIRKISSESATVKPSISHLSIKPGASAELTLLLLPARTRSKIINQRVFIVSNDPAVPTLSLRILASLPQ